jgi:hypothetical protein
MGAGRDGKGLAMRLGAKGGRAHVGYPNLDRTEPLTAETITVLLHLHARRLGLRYRGHEKSSSGLHVTYHDEKELTIPFRRSRVIIIIGGGPLR